MSSGTTEHIVQMANDIGNFFRAETHRQVAVDGIANHINKFWTPRMRRKLLEYVQQGGTGLDELPQAAMAKVIVTPAAAAGNPEPAGGPGPSAACATSK
jgi:formate dehydrogenase subunit delta